MPTMDFGPEGRTRTADPPVQPIIRPRRATIRPELRRQKGPSFFQILDALKSGKLPSNDQLIRSLDAFQNSSGIQSKVRDMSPEGQQLWIDIKEFVDTLKNIIQDKNEDETLQHMMYHSRLAAEAQAIEAARKIGPGFEKEAERTYLAAKKTTMDVFHVLRLLTTNEEIRDVIGDLNSVIQDVFTGFDIAGLGHEELLESPGMTEEERDDLERYRLRRRHPETRTPTPTSRKYSIRSKGKEPLATYEGEGFEEQIVPEGGYDIEEKEISKLSRLEQQLKEEEREESIQKGPQEPSTTASAPAEMPLTEPPTAQRHEGQEQRDIEREEEEEEFVAAEQPPEEPEEESTDRLVVPTSSGSVTTSRPPAESVTATCQASSTTATPGIPVPPTSPETPATLTTSPLQHEGRQEEQDTSRLRGGAGPESARRYQVAEPTSRAASAPQAGMSSPAEEQEFVTGLKGAEKERTSIPRRPVGKYTFAEEGEKEPSTPLRPGVQRRSTLRGTETEMKEKEAFEQPYRAKTEEETEESYFQGEFEEGEEAETATTTTTYTDIALTTEHRERIVNNLMDIFRRMHEEPELRDVMSRVFKRARTSMDKIAGRHHGRASAPVDANAIQATKDLQRLLERFAQNTPMEELRKSIRTLRNRMIEDPRLCEIVENGLFWLERCAGNPYYRDSEEAIFRGSMVIRELRFHMHAFYRHESSTFAREVNTFIRNAREDPQTTELLSRLRAISDDIYEETSGGESHMKTPLIRDFFMVIGPALWDQISLFHVPRVEYSDAQWNVIMDEFDLNMKYFVPENLYMNVGHELMMGLRDTSDSDYSRKVVLKMDDIRPEAVNVPFSYKRKGTLFPIEDRGVADIALQGKTGFTITIHLEIYPEDVEVTLYPTKIQVDMGNVVVNVREAKYSNLYKYGGTFLNTRIRNQLVRSIQNQILQVIEWIDEQVTRIKVRQLEAEAAYTGKELLMHNFDMFLNGMGMSDLSMIMPGVRTRSRRRQSQIGRPGEPFDIDEWRESGWKSVTTTTTTTITDEGERDARRPTKKVGGGQELDVRPPSFRRQTQAQTTPSTSNMPWSSSLFDFSKKMMSRK